MLRSASNSVDHESILSGAASVRRGVEGCGCGPISRLNRILRLRPETTRASAQDALAVFAIWNEDNRPPIAANLRLSIRVDS
jgi:hypothetical protein